MSSIGDIEKVTQNRLIKLFEDELDYDFLGDWKDKEDNSNIEVQLLSNWLSEQHYSTDIINKVIYKLKNTADDQSKSLYDVNKAVYSLLRYGVTVQPETGHIETVWLIDWKNPRNNNFAIAEEVTIKGLHTKRPDIVIYVNGIALGVIELKRSTVSVSEGIRQNLDNQKHIFIKSFFSTIQFVMAGNDNEGIAYGAIETKEKYFLNWKEVSEELNSSDKHLLKITEPIREKAANYDYLLDKNVIEMLNKERFLELIHDFIVFDRGVKKLCRHNQYFGVKAAQDHVARKEGGIIWHTQGSGKSLIMVWLTKWIREFNSNGRVLIITDREELDEQIEKVYKGIDEKIYRTKSGKDLLNKLNDSSPWLICSLVHKFGGKEDGDVDEYLQELKKNIPVDFKAKGDIYVFVDECHRTQSGKLHSAMKEFLPDALFIGFTGTPLLKVDKQTSFEVFGKYIHTYKFDEAVKDKVVLDLRYEAREIEQKINSPEKIDEWFDLKTKGLTDFAKIELKKRWGTIKKIYSSKSRLEKIVIDIMLDMEKKERLQNGRGNAMLVSDSIFNACKYYELFQNAGLKKCAIITSFSPTYADIKGEETGEGNTDKILQYKIYKKMLGDYFNEDPDKVEDKVEQFEKEVKDKFIDEPAQMKLLIVVNKLLTGFDAPPATYLYIDRSMQDHGLFQAVCRVNRLDGEDKDYGYIVDYMDLFQSLEDAVMDYTSGAFDAYEQSDVEGLLKDRLKKAKLQLDDALEAVNALCEPVKPPKGSLDYIYYFCGNTSKDHGKLKDTEPKRVTLYKLVMSLVRAYANIADEMIEAGYTEQEIVKIKKDVTHYENLRKEIQIASGDYVDLKQYEPAMRHLIDSYIGAEQSEVLAKFDDFSLVDLLVERGEEAVKELPGNIKKNEKAVSEVINNNTRKLIIEERPTNPMYYDKMSLLLDSIIQKLKDETLDYKQYLQEIIELAKKVKKPNTTKAYPTSLNNSAKRALYDNLGQKEELAIELNNKIMSTKMDDWKNNKIKIKQVKFAIVEVLEKYNITDTEIKTNILELVKNQSEY